MRQLTMMTAFGASLLIAQPAVAQVTPTSGSVGVTATVGHSYFGPQGGVSDDDAATWAGVPENLSASANAFISTGVTGSANAFGSATATWLSAAEGTVAFDNFGWIILGDLYGNQPTFGSPYADLSSGGPNWAYAFTPDADGLFEIDYTSVAIGSLPPAAGWDLISNGTTLSFGLGSLRPGSFSYALTGGQTYEIALKTRSSISGGTPIIGARDGTFSWRIVQSAPVPEPATWAMLIGGFGLVGGALRRRRRVVAVRVLV